MSIYIGVNKIMKIKGILNLNPKCVAILYAAKADNRPSKILNTFIPLYPNCANGDDKRVKIGFDQWWRNK